MEQSIQFCSYFSAINLRTNKDEIIGSCLMTEVNRVSSTVSSRLGTPGGLNNLLQRLISRKQSLIVVSLGGSCYFSHKRAFIFCDISQVIWAIKLDIDNLRTGVSNFRHLSRYEVSYIFNHMWIDSFSVPFKEKTILNLVYTNVTDRFHVTRFLIKCLY